MEMLGLDNWQMCIRAIEEAAVWGSFKKEQNVVLIQLNTFCDLICHF